MADRLAAVGLRDRLQEGAKSLGTNARDAAMRTGTSARDAAMRTGAALRASDGVRGLRALLEGDDEQSTSLERVLLGVVGAVRADNRDEDDDERTTRDVFDSARRRRRRLGLMSFGAGPLVGVANQLVDLYCETAVVVDLVEVHELDLDDERIAAHMLLLWSITESLDEAQATIDGSGSRTISDYLTVKFRDHAREYLPSKQTKRSAIRALWKARGIAGDVRDAAGAGAVGTAVFPGRRTKQVIERAELQLGVR
jgi:hypothetical protein